MNKATGFTVVELLITVAMAAIVMSVAIPSFQSTIQNNRITSQANEILSAMNLTRSEAVRRGMPVSICASANQATCGGAWTGGWIIFTDRNGDASVNAADEILRVWPPLAGNPNIAGPAAVVYQPSGATNVTINFVHTIPHCVGDQGRTININPTGRAMVQKTDCT